jgi:hypothetical protein
MQHNGESILTYERDFAVLLQGKQSSNCMKLYRQLSLKPEKHLLGLTPVGQGHLALVREVVAIVERSHYIVRVMVKIQFVNYVLDRGK